MNIVTLAATLMLTLAAASPALAQAAADQYDGESVTATGVLRESDRGIYAEMGQDVNHAITDEASGTPYYLKSSTVPQELDRYTGQRVTVYGTVVSGHYPLLVDVERIESAPTDQEKGTIRGVVTDVGGGSVTVEGSPSTDGCDAAILELTERTEVLLQLGEETAVASVDDLRKGQSVEAAYVVPEGPRTEQCPQTYEGIEIIIFTASGAEDPPVRDPGNGGDQYEQPSVNPPEDGASEDGASDGSVKVLPDTGGAALLTLGAGVLLITGGLLARRIIR